MTFVQSPRRKTQGTATSVDLPVKHQPTDMPQSPRHHGATASANWPLAATITGTSKDSNDDATRFDIELKCGTHSWEVPHRYSEFDYLRSQLEKDGITVTDFPRKHLFNTDAVIAERKIELSEFIKCCVLPNWFNPACRAFLEFDKLDEQARRGLNQLLLIYQAMTAIESELKSMQGYLKQAPADRGSRHAMMEVTTANVLELERLEGVFTQVGKDLRQRRGFAHTIPQ